MTAKSSVTVVASPIACLGIVKDGVPNVTVSKSTYPDTAPVPYVIENSWSLFCEAHSQQFGQVTSGQLSSCLPPRHVALETQ